MLIGGLINYVKEVLDTVGVGLGWIGLYHIILIGEIRFWGAQVGSIM